MINNIDEKYKPLYALKAPKRLAIRESDSKDGERYRTVFMRDRDRILYSKAFRRLDGKTQVYLSGTNDHMRNRLTHTLEVSQIARTIAYNLNLDIDLTEAIALGHDLGHTPFGHAGERILNDIMTRQKEHILGKMCPLNSEWEVFKDQQGFKHNLQSLKIAMNIEKNYESAGLDLTNFTLYGIQAHTGRTYNNQNSSLGYYDKFLERGCVLESGNKNFAWSLESFVVAKADEIAQRHHDIEDAIRGKLISINKVKDLIIEHFKDDLGKKETKDLKRSIEIGEGAFYVSVSRIIVNLFVTSLIKTSVSNINELITNENLNQRKFGDYIEGHDPSEEAVKNIIEYENAFKKNAKLFKNDIEDSVLTSYDIQCADAKGKYIIKKLFQAYYENPQQLPDHCICEFLVEGGYYKLGEIEKEKKNYGIGKLRKIFKDEFVNVEEENNKKLVLMRVICDYIAGMTDSYALKAYEKLYG